MAIKLEDQINAVSNVLNIFQNDAEGCVELQVEKSSVDFWKSILESLNNYKQLKESVKTVDLLINTDPLNPPIGGLGTAGEVVDIKV